MKQSVKIITLSTLTAILYGILHNQITARISLEYFTIGHREIIHSISPTLLGIAWGIHPNWWVGMCLGILFVLTGRVGKWGKRDARSFVKPLLFLFLISGITAAAAGIAGYRMANNGILDLYGSLGAEVPVSGHAAYISALWMHTASYTAATMGALVMALFVLTGRIRAGSNIAGTKLP